MLVWLGTECEAALRPLTKQQEAIALGENHDVEQQMRNRGKGEEHAAARKQMEAVFRSAYWQRLWTVQEFELAKEIVFGAGPHFVTYDRLIKHLQYLKFLDKDDPMMIDGAGDSAKPRFYPMLSRITTRKVMTGKPLWHLVMRYGDSQCSEPLGLIYGLLGLTAKTTLAANYKRSPAELCHILPEYGVDKDKIPLALRKAAGL